MVILCKTHGAYAATKREFLLSCIPILGHTCTTSCYQVSISSAQCLNTAHSLSYKKFTHCLTCLPLDLIYQVVLWLLVDKRENEGMHDPLSGNVVSDCESMLYFRTYLSSTIICCSNTETFHIWILNVMLDLIAFLSP